MFLIQDGKINWKLLVLISVLSLGFFAVFLWNSARLKVEARTIARYVVSVKSAREASVKLHSEDKDIQTEKGPNGSVLKVENGVGKKNANFFWITVTVGNSMLCKYLADSEIDYIRVDKAKCSSRHEVTFYFSKYKSTQKGDPDMQNQPDACPANAECDEEFNITNCYFGFYLSDKKCKPCPEKSTNCEGEAFECQIGYRPLNGECVTCGEGVRNCNDNGEPIECLPNYYSIDGACVPCSTLGPGFCSQSSSSGTGGAVSGSRGGIGSVAAPTASVKRSSYSPSSGHKTASSTSSEKCEAGYYKTQSGCLRCPSNHYSAEGATKCTPCSDGYIHNSDHTACVKNVDCASLVNSISLDGNIKASLSGETVVLKAQNSSEPIIIKEDLDFQDCNLRIETGSETYILGNVFAKNLVINSSGNEIFTYENDSDSEIGISSKKIVCSDDLKIMGPFYTNANLKVGGNLTMMTFELVAPAEVKILGYASGESLLTSRDVLSPIKVGRYVSVSGRVHNVQSDDYITASVISSGEAEGVISVEQIQAVGKIISKNGDIIISDERADSDEDNQYTVHVDFGAEISVPNGSINILAGNNVLNMGKILVGKNLNVSINEDFRNWNHLAVGGDLTVTGNVRLAGIKDSGKSINSQTIVCGSINGSGDMQVDTVASLFVGRNVSESLKTRVVQYEGACEVGKGQLFVGNAKYYLQNYATRVKGSSCSLVKLDEEGPFTSSESAQCQNIPWCQQNRYCY